MKLLKTISVAAPRGCNLCIALLRRPLAAANIRSPSGNFIYPSGAMEEVIKSY